MPSANHDANHIRLSRLISDPVTSASSDGSGGVTMALRNDYLNKANRFIQLYLLARGENYGRRNFYVERFIPGLKKTQSVTWASGGTALASDYQYWLEVTDSATTDKILSWHPSKMELDAASNPNVPNAFTILAGSIYGYRSNTQITSGATGTLYYIQNDVRAQAGDTNDISIDSIWFDAIVDIAASFYFEDMGDKNGSFDRALTVLQMLRS